MNLSRNITAFSTNGEYLAYSSPDGCLKIWESSTGILKQEYTPSSHLSATCSSLAWAPVERNHGYSKKSKKLKFDSFSDISNLQLIAMGTMTGDILLYSFTNADLYTCLENGHTSVVNDVVWYGNMLYSCSNDYHIICWEICTGKIKTKWKSSTGAVYSICLIDDNNILTASNTIQWWDIKQKSVKKSFNGHGTEIFRLKPLGLTDGAISYFLSAAVGDRVINAWHLSENSSKSAVASFVLCAEPSGIDILSKHEEPLQISVVSQDGSFNLFEHTFDSNRKLKKPLQPKFSIQIASKSNDSQKPINLPILAANISNGLDFCLLSYGNFLKPAFERINISDISKDLFLIRNISSSSSLSVEDNVVRIKKTEKPNDVKLLAPGHMTNISFSDSSSKKRKKTDLDIKELPMEERLKALDLSKTPQTISENECTIKSSSMVHLLLQGLQSNDNNMLNTVLLCDDEVVIRNSLERLPIQSIFSLLKVLYERLNKREPRNHPCLKWFTALITIHLPYFMSCRDIREYLVPFNQLIAARKDVISKMSRAQGVLKILLSQAMSSISTVADVSSEPLLVYESESSSDEESNVERDQDHSDYSSDNQVAINSSETSSETSDSESEIED